MKNQNQKQPEIAIAPVKSSSLAGAGFDEKTGTMAVLFRNGRKYHYPNVTRKDFDELMNAKSAGKHFNQVIRGKFESVAV